MANELLPCPFCGGAPSMAHRHDEDDCYWSFIECKCGVRTRGHWVSRRSETCPIHFEEVRDEWNLRAALAAKDTPCPHIRGEHGSQWCALAQSALVAGVPAGWKLVPVELTRKMQEEWNFQAGVFRDRKTLWRCILAAAPQPQGDT